MDKGNKLNPLGDQIMLPEYLEGILSGDIPKIKTKAKETKLHLKQAQMISAIDLRFQNKIKIQDIALQLRLSALNVSRIIKAYKKNPIDFVNSINQVTQLTKTFNDDALNAITETVLTNAVHTSSKPKV